MHLREQVVAAQGKTQEETSRFRSDVEGVLRAQLSTAQEMTQQQIDAVASELVQRFGSGIVSERESFMQQQQSKIQRMRSELE